MFLRFAWWEMDEASRVPEGIFCAAFRLLESEGLSEFDRSYLRGLMDWFNDNLDAPHTLYMPARIGGRAGVCWFKPTAREHIAKAFEMSHVLGWNGIFIRMLKAERIGYIVYADEYQVVAAPHREMRM